MPELPEVETTKRKLVPLLARKRILGFWTNWLRGLKLTSQTSKWVKKDIKNRKILKIERRGKAVLIKLSGDRLLAFHQRMSGKILVVPRNLKDKHIHFRFLLSGGKDLILHDIRKFGVVWYGRTAEVLRDKYFSKLGRDPLEISFGDFKSLLESRLGIIKPLLLRQDILAGVGNIVADESLWKAKIHPRKRIEDFTKRELKLLYQAIRYIVSKSIRLGGTTMRDWLHPDKTEGRYFAARFIYGRKGEKCQRCGTMIIRTVVGSRGTFLCPKCQKLK